MLSPLKVKIITWYTGLLAAILIAVFVLLYFLLGYQMSREIAYTTAERIRWTEKALDRDRYYRESEKPIDIPRSRVFRHGIREFTDQFDDRCLLAVYRGDQLLYLSKQFEDLRPAMRRFSIPNATVADIAIDPYKFKMASLYREGQVLYIGYALSEVKEMQMRIINLFAIIFPFGILLSIAVGYGVTQRSLNIIHKITRTVDRITSQSMDQRVPVPDGRDEITELIKTLNAMIDRLERSFLAARQFSHDAAHELRTPLTVLRGELEMLLEQPIRSKSMRQSLTSVLEEIQYLSYLADKLLLLYDFDTGRLEYHFTEVELDSLIRETVEDAEILAKTKNLGIKLDSCTPLSVQGDRVLLLRLLWNLLDNAIKYTPESGIITVSLERLDGNAVIKIRDTGIGIAPEEQKKIFERFYRVDQSRSRRMGGSGLGLSICRQIVKQHQGSIRLESAPGEGSCFEVTIPLADFPRP